VESCNLEFKSLRLEDDIPLFSIYHFSDAAVDSRHRERMNRGTGRLDDAVIEERHSLCRSISGSPCQASQRFFGGFVTQGKNGMGDTETRRWGDRDINPSLLGARATWQSGEIASLGSQ
jgi:hypothetical protein